MFVLQMTGKVGDCDSAMRALGSSRWLFDILMHGINVAFKRGGIIQTFATDFASDFIHSKMFLMNMSLQVSVGSEFTAADVTTVLFLGLRCDFFGFWFSHLELNLWFNGSSIKVVLLIIKMGWFVFKMFCFRATALTLLFDCDDFCLLEWRNGIN